MSASQVPPDLAGYVYWILGEDGRTPVAVSLDSGVEWSNRNGSVALFRHDTDRGTVSTVFLPTMLEEGLSPSPFETMARKIGGGRGFGRWSTYAEAAEGHAAAVATLEAGA